MAFPGCWRADAPPIENIIACVLSAFGDESSDESKQRVFAVAGILGTKEQWGSLVQSWVERTGGKEFHAADCDSDQGDYKNSPHHENKKLYADVTNLLANAAGLMGLGVAIPLQVYRSVFPGAEKDLPYYLCFHDVVKDLAKMACLSVPPEVVQFTFDITEEREYNAGYLYSLMVQDKKFRFFANIADKISFACSKKATEIQAADLLVRETMKHLDNQIGPSVRRTRKSIEALAGSKRFRFQFHTLESLQELKKQAESVARSSNPREYKEWLVRNGLTDNLSSKMKYVKFTSDAIN
jgi:hypothetical protein